MTLNLTGDEILRRFKKVYVVSLNSLVTGGPESLHQLASEIQKLGFETYVYYIDTKTINVPEKFRKYKVPVCTKIEDSEENLIITPEVHTEVFNNLKKTKKVIWWLSLDYYLQQFPKAYTRAFSERNKIPYYISFPLLLIMGRYKKNFFKFRKKEKEVVHFYNCEYVNEYLKTKQVPNNMKMYLCGPLSSDFFDYNEKKDKKDIVIFNPKKDSTFIKKIEAYAQMIKLDVQFIPIENMTSSECIDLMKQSKLYMDFGYFPGPERLPREAVMNYCNIITGLEGSSKNDLDVPIPRKFKFEKKESNIPEICKMISELTNNYEENLFYFDDYRRKVKEQRFLFKDNIKSFFD
ncbi:hypothetical protein [Vagococcus fluvialis]|uniref:hypothetical protein n=1 Tax=Vagococcus fluvialis TaxID=2738 RepID=UPI0037DCDFAE